ncbi:MAG: ABC transporter permease [Methanomassiliicoccales archaeon]|nr:ABC transporter permease [Methanomassiliicoccales archaeon]
MSPVNARRMLAISRKVLRSLKHDRRTVGFLVLMPIFMIAIFGFTFGGEVKGVEVYVVDLDQGVGDVSFADVIVHHLEQDGTLKIKEIVTSSSGPSDPVAYGREKVEKGDAWACIVFPADFTMNIISFAPGNTSVMDTASITLLLDGSNTNIMRSVTSTVQTTMAVVLYEDVGFTSPVRLSMDMVYGDGMEFIDTFAPGVISLAVMMVTFMLSIISFIHERTTGTLARLLSTPVTEGEVVLGYALAFGLIGLIQSVMVMATALLLFNVQVEGSLLLVLLTIFLLGVGMQGLGFLLSANARTEFQAIQFIPLILFPSILLSGVFWPIQAVPEVLRPISYFLPLTYAVDGARSIMVRGWGLELVWPDLVILTLFAMAMLTISVLLMKRR